MNKNYYSLVQNGSTATLNIYGDITSWPLVESDVTAYNLSKQLDEMQNIAQLDVYINSYGGEVAEGLAIYNALKRKAQTANVTTYCDGFACSIASVIFMAGTERKMSKSSLLMIHNAWTFAEGNAEELRKMADDLEVITSASVEAYKSVASISEKKIRELMDAESWITPKDAKKYGFVTEIIEENAQNPSQSVKSSLISLILQEKTKENDEDSKENDKDEKEPENEPKDAENEKKQFKCVECGFVYEGDELPEEYECPECGSAEFEEVTEEPEEPEEPEEKDIPEDEEEDKEEPSEKLAGFFNLFLRI